MIKQRVNCWLVGCSTCSNGVFVKKNYWGKKLYSCPAYPKKHLEISGRDCGSFRCNNQSCFNMLCQNCRKGL